MIQEKNLVAFTMGGLARNKVQGAGFLRPALERD